MDILTLFDILPVTQELHGEVEIDYVNGDYFWGDMEHGVKVNYATYITMVT